MPSFTLITGASAGIGQATAQRLAKEGRNLILLARRKDRLENLKKKLAGTYKVTVMTEEIDVTDFTALEAFFTTLKDTRIDVVVNNAGLALARDPFDRYDFADVQRMIDVNISAFLKVAHLSLPFLKASKGHLINLGSVAGMEAYGGGAVYCGTKHFVHAFTHALRIDLLGSGVRVTTIAPGSVETEFSQVRFKGDVDKARSVYQGFQPLKAEDIADTIRYVLSAPAHVNTELMLVMPTAQAGGNIVKTK